MVKKYFMLIINFLFLMSLVGNSFINAQETPTPSITATIDIERIPENAPIRLGILKIGDLPLSFSNQPQNIQQTDWLRNMSFKVKNLTDKKVTYIGIYLQLPETEMTGLRMLHTITFGRFSAFTREGQSATLGERNQPFELASSSNLDVLVKSDYDKLARFVESRQPISTINSVIVSIIRVGFEDGTFWTNCGAPSCYSKYDSEDPRQLVRLPAPKLIPFSENPF